MVEQAPQQEMSDEEAIMKIAEAMKGNEPTAEEKHSVFTFLYNIATSKDSTKVGNLRDDKDMNELGHPSYTVRGAKSMALISRKIMDNDYFAQYFEAEAEDTNSTSLSREGFLVRQASTQTKQVADVTKRKTINKGWVGKKSIEESGGEPTYGK